MTPSPSLFGAAGLKDEPLDVAIVGAGVAGCHVAYRLVGSRPDWKIGLFERSGRVGGRLLSLHVPDGDRVPAELGGMRFRTSQPLVSGLVHELGLKTRPFLTVHEDNRFFLRGARWRAGDPGHATAVYQLKEDERSLSPGELLVAAFERVVPGATRLSEEEWAKVKRQHWFEGRLLRDWSLGDLLAAVLSEEGHRYVVDGFGYAALLGARNAADAIPWVLIETRPESENETLVDGMERLPRELAERFVVAGGHVYPGYDLVGLEKKTTEGSALLRLHFDGRADVNARRVVLAVPRRALELIGQHTPLLSAPDVRLLIASVAAQPAAKLYLRYDRPWWRDSAFLGRREVSDLALSKTYYFDRRGESVPSGSALMLASYSDGPSRDYWCALADGGVPPLDSHPLESERRWQSYAASVRQVAEAQRQLLALHQIDEIPDPIGSAFMDWGADPFGGGWHVWNSGAKSWEVMSRMIQPVPSQEVYICGEAYTSSQGWVEGALESAERVVSRLA